MTRRLLLTSHFCFGLPYGLLYMQINSKCVESEVSKKKETELPMKKQLMYVCLVSIACQLLDISQRATPRAEPCLDFIA